MRVSCFVKLLIIYSVYCVKELTKSTYELSFSLDKSNNDSILTTYKI